jgi:hypothetical protein
MSAEALHRSFGLVHSHDDDGRMHDDDAEEEKPPTLSREQLARREREQKQKKSAVVHEAEITKNAEFGSDIDDCVSTILSLLKNKEKDKVVRLVAPRVEIALNPLDYQVRKGRQQYDIFRSNLTRLPYLIRQYSNPNFALFGKQKEIVKVFSILLAPKIFGPDWEIERMAFMKEFNVTDFQQFVWVSMSRQFGKTTCLAFCIACLLVSCYIRVLLFAVTERATIVLLGQVKEYVNLLLNQDDSRIAFSSRQKLTILPVGVDKKKLNTNARRTYLGSSWIQAVPGGTDSKYRFRFCFSIIDISCHFYFVIFCLFLSYKSNFPNMTTKPDVPVAVSTTQQPAEEKKSNEKALDLPWLDETMINFVCGNYCDVCKQTPTTFGSQIVGHFARCNICPDFDVCKNCCDSTTSTTQFKLIREHVKLPKHDILSLEPQTRAEWESGREARDIRGKEIEGKFGTSSSVPWKENHDKHFSLPVLLNNQKQAVFRTCTWTLRCAPSVEDMDGPRSDDCHLARFTGWDITHDTEHKLPEHEAYKKLKKEETRFRCILPMPATAMCPGLYWELEIQHKSPHFNTIVNFLILEMFVDGRRVEGQSGFFAGRQTISGFAPGPDTRFFAERRSTKKKRAEARDPFSDDAKMTDEDTAKPSVVSIRIAFFERQPYEQPRSQLFGYRSETYRDRDETQFRGGRSLPRSGGYKGAMRFNRRDDEDVPAPSFFSVEPHGFDTGLESTRSGELFSFLPQQPQCQPNIPIRSEPRDQGLETSKAKGNTPAVQLTTTKDTFVPLSYSERFHDEHVFETEWIHFELKTG